MLIFSLITLAIAIVSIRISANITDEIDQIMVALIALLFAGLSLIFAPLAIKLLIVVTFFITKKHIYTSNQDN